MVQQSHPSKLAGMAAALGLGVSATVPQPELGSLPGDSRGPASADVSVVDAYDNQTSDTTLSDPSPLLNLPALYRLALNELSDPVRIEVERAVREEFSRPDPTTAGRYVEVFAEALAAAGFSTGQTEATLAAMLSQGVLTFNEHAEAIDMLVTLFPDNEYFREQQQTILDSVLPEGGVRLSWVSSAGGSFGFDFLTSEREERRDKGWLPDPDAQLPVALYVQPFRFSYNNASVSKDDWLKVSGEIKVWTSGEEHNEPLLQQAVSAVFPSIPSDRYQESEHLIFITDIVPDAAQNGGLPPALILQFTYSIEQHRNSPEAKAAGTPTPEFMGESRLLLEPQSAIDENNNTIHLGYKFIPLSPWGQQLPEPVLADEYPLTATYNILIWTKDPSRQAAIRDAETEKAQGTLIGREITSVPLMYPGAEGEKLTLDIPRSGDVILIFGATWCGPCGRVAPPIANFISEKRDNLRVFRISIDNDPDRFAAAVKGNYPDGVIAARSWEGFGIRGVPSFIRLSDGVVTESGILHPNLLDAWSEEYTDR